MNICKYDGELSKLIGSASYPAKAFSANTAATFSTK